MNGHFQPRKKILLLIDTNLILEGKLKVSISEWNYKKFSKKFFLILFLLIFWTKLINCWAQERNNTRKILISVRAEKVFLTCNFEWNEQTSSTEELLEWKSIARKQNIKKQDDKRSFLFNQRKPPIYEPRWSNSSERDSKIEGFIDELD